MSRAITINEFCARLGVSRMSLYRLRRDGEVPPPIPTSRRCVRWSVAAIEQWEELGYPHAAELAALVRTQRRFEKSRR